MPRKVSPPCAYIREVCYNDCAPPVIERAKHNAAKRQTRAIPPTVENATSPEPRDRDPQRSLLAGLLLALLLN